MAAAEAALTLADCGRECARGAYAARTMLAAGLNASSMNWVQGGLCYLPMTYPGASWVGP